MGVLSWLFPANNVQRHAKRSTHPRTRPRGRTRNGRVVIEIRRNSRQLYEERGWRRQGSTLHGYYRTRYKSYQGRIENAFATKQRYIIIKPDEKLLKNFINGPHSACFTEIGKNEYGVHFFPKPDNVNTGILRMEHHIFEALQ